MLRSVAYRHSMPIHILQLMDVASRITLFQVGQNGPLSFIFKDRLNAKFKTSIGNTVNCTCSPNRNDHCIHSIISIDNPIIWQASYIDSQLEDLLAGRFTTISQQRRLVRPMLQTDPLPQLPSDKLRYDRVTQQHKQKVQKLPLNNDSVCPICQQLMQQQQLLSYCYLKCGNNYHNECIKIWATNRFLQDKQINCPMCRITYKNDFIRELEYQAQQFIRKKTELLGLKFNCSCCGLKNIIKGVHKCILCTSYQLCHCCYNDGKHIKHPFLFLTDDGRWRGAEERRDKEIKLKNALRDKWKQKQSPTAQIIQKLRKIQQDPSKIIDFVASSYPYVSKFISENIDPYKSLGFKAEDMKCMKCGSKRMIFLRRLNCGHFIDHQCLKKCIIKGKFYCQQDGSKILKGYENLSIMQKELEKKRQNIQRNHQYKIEKQFDSQHLNIINDGSHSNNYRFRKISNHQLQNNQQREGNTYFNNNHNNHNQYINNQQQNNVNQDALQNYNFTNLEDPTLANLLESNNNYVNHLNRRKPSFRGIQETRVASHSNHNNADRNGGKNGKRVRYQERKLSTQKEIKEHRTSDIRVRHLSTKNNHKREKIDDRNHKLDCVIGALIGKTLMH